MLYSVVPPPEFTKVFVVAAGKFGVANCSIPLPLNARSVLVNWYAPIFKIPPLLMVISSPVVVTLAGKLTVRDERITTISPFAGI